MRSKNKEKMLMTGIITLLGIFLFVLISCKSPHDPEAEKATVYVYNEYGVALDIFMDGNFKFSVEFSDSDVIENVEPGLHVFEAKKIGTDEIIASDSMEIAAGGNYEWTIMSLASLKVTNEYGETLSIYANDTYLGDIDDQESQSVSNFPYGEYQLKALRTSDETEVASTTINIVEDKEYLWTISK